MVIWPETSTVIPRRFLPPPLVVPLLAPPEEKKEVSTSLPVDGFLVLVFFAGDDPSSCW